MMFSQMIVSAGIGSAQLYEQAGKSGRRKNRDFGASRPAKIDHFGLL